MESDRELLRQYAEAGHQAAFAEVVRRHTDLVYSAALRLVAGDAPQAQDVAQTVFTTLARKAGSLAGRDNLLGWLHTTTRYAASVAGRGERRRRAREQEAATMMTNDHPAPTEMDWLPLQSTLDEAVGCLGAQDREAVLLRFFQGKTHREVAAELGWNEVLARKRVDRALEKLRGHLSRRGVTLSTALLAGAITTHSVQAAPEGLAASLSSVSLTTAGEVGTASLFWQGIFLIMKTKTIIIAAALVLGLLLLGTWWRNQPGGDTEGKTAAALLPANVNTAKPSPLLQAETAAGNGPASAPANLAESQNAANPAPVGSDPRENLNATVLDILRLVGANDYVALVRNYLNQKGQDVPLEQDIQNRAADPDMQQMFQQIGQLLASAQNTAPVFSADGRSARFRTTPDAAAVVLVQTNGLWHIAGLEAPPPDPSHDSILLFNQPPLKGQPIIINGQPADLPPGAYVLPPGQPIQLTQGTQIINVNGQRVVVPPPPNQGVK